jgi:hypothetical protein
MQFGRAVDTGRKKPKTSMNYTVVTDRRPEKKELEDRTPQALAPLLSRHYGSQRY